MPRKGVPSEGLSSSPVIRERPVRNAAAVALSLILPPLGLKTETLPLEQPKSDGFVEPELATPKPGYSGYTLESLPPAKQKRTVRKGKLLTAKLSPEIDSVTLQERESSYRGNLKTPELERLTGVSELRSIVETVPKPRPVLALLKRKGTAANSSTDQPAKRVKLIILLPSTPRLLPKVLDLTPTSRASKKIKIISPKRRPLLLVPASTAPTSDSNTTNNNDDFCSSCGGTGIFICCDLCPKSFHLLCCSPPLLEVPEDDDWNCCECRAARQIDPKPSWNSFGVFGLLLNDLHGSNPTEFCLPKYLRESTFMNVYTGDDNQYMDTLLKEEGDDGFNDRGGPSSTNGSSNGGQLPGCNRNEDLEIDSLYDKEGNPYLCHKCGDSGLKHRTLIFCDFCPLVWHLDCLDQPMCSPKTLGLKWRCPNHIESLIPSYWQERRGFKETIVVDSGVQNNFLRYLLASNYLIKFTDQPYINDCYAPLLPEYLHFQRNDFISNKSNLIEAANNSSRATLNSNGTKNHSESSNGNESNSEKSDIDANFKIPAFLQSYGVNEGVVARSSKKLSRMLSLTNGDDPKTVPVVYRVPEEHILIDFVKKGKNTRQKILKELEEYDRRAIVEQDQDEAAISFLLSLKLQHFVKREEPNSISKEENESVTVLEDVTKNDETKNVLSIENVNKAPNETQSYSDELQKLKVPDLEWLEHLVATIGKEKLLQLVSAI